MSFTPAQLKTEVTTDPLGLGYAQWVAGHSIGADVQIANLINALTGAGAANITMPTMTAAQIATIMLPLFGAATGLTAVQYAYYTLMFSIVMSQQGPIPVSLLSAFGAEMVTNGILTSAQASAIGQRIGSRGGGPLGRGDRDSSDRRSVRSQPTDLTERQWSEIRGQRSEVRDQSDFRLPTSDFRLPTSPWHPSRPQPTPRAPWVTASTPSPWPMVPRSRA